MEMAFALAVESEVLSLVHKYVFCHPAAKQCGIWSHCNGIFLFCTEEPMEVAPSQTYDVVITATSADATLVAFIKGELKTFLLHRCRRPFFCMQIRALLVPV